MGTLIARLTLFQMNMRERNHSGRWITQNPTPIPIERMGDSAHIQLTMLVTMTQVPNASTLRSACGLRLATYSMKAASGEVRDSFRTRQPGRDASGALKTRVFD